MRWRAQKIERVIGHLDSRRWGVDAAGEDELLRAARTKRTDTVQGGYEYSRRLIIMEPVFANLCIAHRRRRFSLPGKRKVNAQRVLYCPVHDIGKVQRNGACDKQAR